MTLRKSLSSQDSLSLKETSSTSLQSAAWPVGWAHSMLPMGVFTPPWPAYALVASLQAGTQAQSWGQGRRS